MEYIIHTDFHDKAICGVVNLPRGTVCTEDKGIIYHKGKPLCYTASENGYKHFARNDDGRGLERGDLITKIKTTLAIDDEHSYERWHRVWNAPICKQFNRNRNGDTWIWNFAFYNAEIAYLEHISALVTDENWLGIEPPEVTE